MEAGPIAYAPPSRNEDDADGLRPAEYRDLVIEELAAREQSLLVQVLSLETDVSVYRELLIASCDALRDLTVRHQRLQQDKQQVIDEYRAFRQQMLIPAEYRHFSTLALFQNDLDL